jgi:hypothetical protein
MVAMLRLAGIVAAEAHAVIPDVGIGEAMHGVIAMTEGHRRGRRHQAQRREERQTHRYAETWPRAQRCKHGPSLLALGGPRKVAVLHKMRYQRPMNPAHHSRLA